MPITVKEVVEAAARLVGSTANLEDESSEEVLLLVRCFNFVENEVALDYFPLKRTEEVAVSDKMEYAALSSAPVHILRVTDPYGCALAFEAFPAYLDLKGYAGSANVTYAYAPAAKRLGENSDFAGAVSARLLAYGTATEYLLACGRLAEATVYDEKYREAIRAAGQTRRPLAMRSRRWI